MSDLVTQAPNLEVHEVPDGYIVYQSDRDRVHYLNKTAAIIFEFCNGAHAIDEIVARVAAAFELGAAAHDEIRTGLDSLLREGLILSPSK
ncbi:MAG: PqqD family peptide modification chaperone [Xanthobacteraceae bacterium]|nr:PqqD family peptide modification chaperone [Xanthobacteraceae bacterium]